MAQCHVARDGEPQADAAALRAARGIEAEERPEHVVAPVRGDAGSIVINKDIEVKIEGRDIIIVEDIVDSGLTLTHVYRILSDKGASSIRVATLLEKPGNSKYEGKLDYVGFQIPNSFVVGYGLDFNERYRNLPCIGVLKPKYYGGKG